MYGDGFILETCKWSSKPFMFRDLVQFSGSTSWDPLDLLQPSRPVFVLLSCLQQHHDSCGDCWWEVIPCVEYFETAMQIEFEQEDQAWMTTEKVVFESKWMNQNNRVMWWDKKVKQKLWMKYWNSNIQTRTNKVRFFINEKNECLLIVRIL